MLDFRLPEGKARSLWIYCSQHGVLELRADFALPSSLEKGPLQKYGTLELRWSPADCIAGSSNRTAEAEGDCPISGVPGSRRNES